MQAKHGQKMKAEVKQFGTMKGRHSNVMHTYIVIIIIIIDFQIWKDEFEGKTNSQFVRGTGEKKGTDASTIYYYCNRSGHAISRSTIRHSKFQGSCKIDTHCTAAIVLTKEARSNSISAQVYKTHYGHQCSLGKIRFANHT